MLQAFAYLVFIMAAVLFVGMAAAPFLLEIEKRHR